MLAKWLSAQTSIQPVFARQVIKISVASAGARPLAPLECNRGNSLYGDPHRLRTIIVRRRKYAFRVPAIDRTKNYRQPINFNAKRVIVFLFYCRIKQEGRQELPGVRGFLSTFSQAIVVYELLMAIDVELQIR